MRRNISVLRVAGRCGLGLRPLWGSGSTPAFAGMGGGLRAPVLSQRCSPAAGVLSPWLASVRCFSSDRKEGSVKMWNEERGFGFITPAGGGEDVFVHRSSLREGVLLAPGQIVSFDAQWDDKKRKDRAADVAIASPGEGGGGEAPSGGGGQPAPQPAAGGRPAAYNIVGSFADWAIHREAMAGESGGPVRHRVTVRSGAPKSGGGDQRREEFQIVGDGNWDKRLYPAGGDKEETVILRPGGAFSRAASDRGKGHGRNWAVEGKPGAVFDIIYDPEAQTISCEQPFSESK